ncbi:CvpA family protein [Hyphococcus flavus]|uniref:CvpA family protein n=1 Tax=Hyphococcus flavus TaxID=1866326 RepID=A0AAF0CEQ3_9PROT|nr:CvpA family protein [Hyphococcus flavus]WDI30569.1 CvpA family protein [Hyphococcus flavus]
MFDLLFVVVVGLSTAFAVLRGGLRELSTLLALGIAGGLTLLFIEPLLAVTGQAGSFFGTAIIAAVLIAVFFLAAHIGLHIGLKRFPLEGRAALADRIGGGVFGFVRGLVLIGLGYLGYTYYIDEAKQPSEVQTAMTQPLASSMASWFETFTPETADLDAPIKLQSEEGVDATVSGYPRSDRNGLNEIVTTVTTTDPTISSTAPGAVEEPEEVEEDDLDAIADILQEDQPQ